MPYTTHRIAPIIGALLPPTAPDHPVEHLLTDSRQISFPASSLFFALHGPRHDGHHFVREAYLADVRSFVVERLPDAGDFPEACFLQVPDTLTALQQLAAYHRRAFHGPVIGVTGSNGKTIVKEWLFQVLSPGMRTLRSPRSYNSQVGVPLSVWQLRPDHELAIFEAGISHRGEMERLARMIRPSIGLFTNIGPAHAEGFSSTEEKIREKLELFREASVVICRLDDERVNRALAELGRPLFTWSTSREADLRITDLRRDGNQTFVRALFRGQPLEMKIPFTDEASLENAVHCWAAGLYLGLETAVLGERLACLEPIAMRLELREGINGCTLINDSYNSDLHSLGIALHFLDQQRRGSRSALILSDILQSGEAPAALYGRVGALLCEHQVDRLIAIGREIAELKQHLPPGMPAVFYPDTDAFLDVFREEDFHSETILLKGARRFAFERIERRLLHHTHRTVLEVNLSALAHNLRVFHRQLAPGVRLMVMVKAAAYGGGGLEVARLLDYQGVRYLAVAYTDEGVELRRGGIEMPILVLNPEADTFEALARHRLEAEIYSLEQLEAFARFSRSEGLSLPIHLKLDTGMHRLGFEPAGIEALLERLRHHPQLRVLSVFTHLVASESPEHDDFTHEQMRRFRNMYAQIVRTLGYQPLRHALNTSGILRFGEYQMDMVRLGIGLYGVETVESLSPVLRPALRLRATISQIRNVAPPETIGYGRRGRPGRPSRIATISIGYADGLLRSAGNGRFAVHIHGKPAPTIGNICMDMSMVDVTDIPEAREGDEVVLFSEEWPLEQLARVYGTIPYEVLTGISGRVRRVYVQE